MSNQKLSYPVFHGNDLTSIIKWIEAGDYVVIHSPKYGLGRFFHAHCKTISIEEQNEYVKRHRVIYVDITKLPGLCSDGEWEWYIKNRAKGGCECTCGLKSITEVSSNVPNSYLLQLTI